MPNPTKENASGEAGVHVDHAGGPETTEQKKTISCSSHHINNVLKEIRIAGLRLRSSAGDTQLETLPKLLQHMGPRGLNTYEGVAAGYLRIATRIKDLEDAWVINSFRENVIGPDGLFHKGVARYVLVGKRKGIQPVQRTFDLGAA